MSDVVIIIPAYNPDQKFISFLKDLTEAGYDKIIIINDGSREETQTYFAEAVERYGCDLVAHSINLGQGRAYKSGFNQYLLKAGRGGAYDNTIGLIQCDCDGQHKVEDVNKCADLLRENPEKFILGIRDFSDKNIPFRSRFGNKCTNLIFKFFCGLDIKDTQTGLKGIPKSFLPKLMETLGERFEYASSVLLETKKSGLEILQFPIQTIYIDGNETSHFNPFLDSIRIYSLILKYLMSSLSSFIFDVILYSMFLLLFREISEEYYIIISTYLSRIILSTYVFFINKYLVFHSKGNLVPIAFKFFLLCIIQATLSGFLTRSFVLGSGLNAVLCKIMVDTVLFFASFQIQNRWIFKK